MSPIQLSRRSAATCWSRIVRPPTSSSSFGTPGFDGPSRMPRPAPRMITSTEASLARVDRAQPRLQPVQVEVKKARERPVRGAVEVRRAREQQPELVAELGEQARVARVVGGIERLDPVDARARVAPQARLDLRRVVD